MNFLSQKARSITPYTAGEQLFGSFIKLNANENPYPPSPCVRDVLQNFRAEGLNRYPFIDAAPLRKAIAQAEGVRAENVFCSNGSDETLALSFAAFFDPEGKGACFADITYSFYPVYARLFSVPVVTVPLEGDFKMNFTAMKRTDCQGYFIANPNAPTGIGVPKEEMENFIASVPEKLVIADEAYMDFYGQSCVPLTEKYQNLLVVKTFSKSYSLAGIRCGYAVGNKALIDGLTRMKDCFNSYPVDALCQAVCAAAIGDREYHDKTVSLVKGERDRLREELIALGFTVPESNTNFLFAGRAKVSAEEIYLKLKQEGVLVRFWDKPVLRDFCRITVGTKEENGILMTKLKNILL